MSTYATEALSIVDLVFQIGHVSWSRIVDVSTAVKSVVTAILSFGLPRHATAIYVRLSRPHRGTTNTPDGSPARPQYLPRKNAHSYMSSETLANGNAAGGT